MSALVSVETIGAVTSFLGRLEAEQTVLVASAETFLAVVFENFIVLTRYLNNKDNVFIYKVIIHTKFPYYI